MSKRHPLHWDNDSIQAHEGYGDNDGLGGARGIIHALLIVALIMSAIVWAYLGVTALGAPQ